MRSTCTVIQGPPGTGKTHVSVQIMKMWSKTLDLSPLLATSDSNPAVDNIAIGLRKEGVRAVRVGRPDKINRILEEITCLGGDGRALVGHPWGGDGHGEWMASGG
eukprot:Skav231773  [mRNA]  locus=scaffold3283:76062:77820:+ [translate_table: standard]